MTRVPGFLLRDRVTIEDYAGSSAYGDTFSAGRSGVKASVEPTNRLIVTRDGQQARAEALMVIRPEDGPVPVGSRVTWGGEAYIVLSAGAIPNEVRPSHRELWLGKE